MIVLYKLYSKNILNRYKFLGVENLKGSEMNCKGNRSKYFVFNFTKKTSEIKKITIPFSYISLL